MIPETLTSVVGEVDYKAGKAQPDQSANKAHDSGLPNQLSHNPLPCSFYCPLDADFPGALGDADRHCVDHGKTSNHYADQGNTQDDCVEMAMVDPNCSSKSSPEAARNPGKLVSMA